MPEHRLLPSVNSGGRAAGSGRQGRVGLCMAVVAVDGTPGGGLQAAGGGTGIGLCMALVAIVALAWLPLWIEVVVGSAISTSRSMPARRLTPTPDPPAPNQ